MRLVLLDRSNLAQTASLSALEELGELAVYEKTEPLEAFNRLKRCDVLLTVEVPVGRALLDWAPRLRQVVVLSARGDLIDTRAAADLGVTVTLLGNPESLIEEAAGAIREALGGSR